MTSTAATTPRRGPVTAYSVFRNRSFTLLWFAQLVSVMGSSMTTLVSTIYIFRITGSTMNVGLMLMASSAPSLVFGLIAGVFVDRYDRRRIMIAADVLRALTVILIPILIPHSIVWLYVLTVATAAVTQFFDPAHASVVPELASEEELVAANSMLSLSSFGATTLGFALAGIVTSRYPIEWAFYFDALSYLLSAVLIFLIRIPHIPAEEGTTLRAVGSNFVAGLRTISGTAALASAMILGVLVSFFFGLNNTLMLPFTIAELHATELQYGFVESASMIGLVIGSLLMAQFGNRLRDGQWIAISLLAMGLVSTAFALTYALPVALFLSMLGGIPNSPWVVGQRTLLQRNTAREMRGRVFSASFVTRDTIFVLGMAAAGLADYVGVRNLLLVSALGTFAVGILAIFMPGIGIPGSEWRRTLALLRQAANAQGMSPARSATMADMDLLLVRQPGLARMDAAALKRFVASTSVREAAEGAVILREGDASDAAYFVIDGRAVAGREENGEQCVLEVIHPGDFFGEIAALTGLRRTANVVAEVATTLLEVPAKQLHIITADPQLNKLVVSRMTSRMARSGLVDLPRSNALDQDALLELRTPMPEAA